MKSGLIASTLALALVAGPPPAPSRGAGSGPSTVGALRLEGDFGALSKPARYSYVILNAWEYPLIDKLKAADPRVRVLVYKNMAATTDYGRRIHEGRPFLTTGVGYRFARRYHPEWFLRDGRGRRIEWCDYDGAWQMDVGARSYQRKWLANVSEELERYGWDGVMVDDAMADPWAHLCGRRIARYPEAEDYADATQSFLKMVGPRLMSRGLSIYPNINDADVGTWRRWMGFVSGGVREWWTKRGTRGGRGYFGGHHWEFQMDQMRATHRAGKDFIAITYSSPDDSRAMRYARASFLLGGGGRRDALIFHTGAGRDPWRNAWTIDIGEPEGPARFGSGVWFRPFRKGAVVVNPSSRRTATLSLGRGYSKPGGTRVTEITLPPKTGSILIETASAGP